MLDLVGDGWWAAELDAEIAAAGWPTHVVRHGRVDEQTKADLLGQAWLMVLPSVKEGWGIAVMEAAARGTPTVAYAERGRYGRVGGRRRDRGAGRRRGRAAGRGGRAAAATRNGCARSATAARERAATFTWDEAAAGFERVLPSGELLAVDEGRLLGGVLVGAGGLRLHEAEHRQERQKPRR